MRDLIEKLCSDECAGRAPGTLGGELARKLVIEALRGAGLDPVEQRLEVSGGANVLAKIGGDVASYIVVGAHFDHLGAEGGRIYRGADDNAAAVAILVEVARTLAAEHTGRGAIIAAFDAEEPPHFQQGSMGSQVFVRENRDPIDFMVCMDLVGHRLGPAGVPDEVGASVFALGGERSAGTLELVQSLKRAEPGIIARPADAEIIPPLSDYAAFWERRIPFLFLSAGRPREYHTPDDTPDKLDYGKIAATARWLTTFVRAARLREPTQFVEASLHRGTLEELEEILVALSEASPLAEQGLARVRDLRAACDRHGNLPSTRRRELEFLVQAVEEGLQHRFI